MRIQKYRRIEAFEARKNATVGILHDALRSLVGPRPQQHADYDVVLRARGIFTQQLVHEARQTLIHLIGEFEAQRVIAVRADLCFLGDFANQARNKSRLVEQSKVAEELDFGLNVHPAGKKSMGLVAVSAATSFASNLNRRMRASSLFSNSGSLSSDEMTCAAVMSPDGAMVSSMTTLPCRAGLSRRARAYIASMAPLFLVNTRAISSEPREALPLPPARVPAWPPAANVGSLICAVRIPFSEPEPAASPLLVGALIPPLVPPAFDWMSDRWTTLTSPGSVVFGWFLANLS